MQGDSRSSVLYTVSFSYFHLIPCKNERDKNTKRNFEPSYQKDYW